MHLSFSFIIPVYNRPQEIKELLESFVALKTISNYEIVIVEDGSLETSKTIVDTYSKHLNISYYFKSNSGPGDSRNYGMQRAKGNYFIILDSDCILPEHYLQEVEASLASIYVDCYGGPDAAHTSFTSLQKAIDFCMTSFITTGGIRGKKNSINKFQPRSFNMGLSKKAFEATGGFGNIHPGEDPDLSIRLWALGFKTKLIPKAFVYHKRRISWSKFYKQVYKFGKVRPILNKWHPHTQKLTYWFPTVFVCSVLIAVCYYFVGVPWMLFGVLAYYAMVFISAVITTKSIGIALHVLLAVTIQFFGYGIGFLKATLMVQVLRKNPKVCFPELFFKL